MSEFLTGPQGQGLIYRSIAGGNREGLNYEQIRGFGMPWPERSERREIANRLLAMNGYIRSEVLVLEKHRSVKQGLMQDLLTGRVAVDHLVESIGEKVATRVGQN